ncbi:hypothetical protein GPECTOR_19g258 [Gonium pectorale]|uniref:Isopenicillin N synthase-like Fe(2+) 2OG dioxygenase domain-containing protein n=1 Tax=Gonium pectorale TaxID=33097 RepID=A0A150GJ16_GONPE|nr:hypothetical protein GPECTOR_19g258 [Gonium pectorale]|eukprot:KXZ49807.1 hypothetical protein GPECTOR_19g258 [Gonium pectorale]
MSRFYRLAGKESMSPGVRDTKKGSYYANPEVDDQLQAAGLGEERRREHPGYYGRNIWPREDLPELEPAFKAAGGLVCAVGRLLAAACDRYVTQRLGAPEGHVSRVIQQSTNHKARLLHYFPPEPAAGGSATHPQRQVWCGWHFDHGSLTGLMRAMYIDASGAEVPCPNPHAGLYIRDRHGRVVRVTIPADCLAFQVGEALQVQSGGLLRATAHYVRAAEGPAAVGVSRDTFAVFMQPNVQERMDCPPGVSPKQVEVTHWKPGMNFGQFAEEKFKVYYR